MPTPSPDVAFVMLAGGLLDLADVDRADATVRQDRTMPPRLRRALSLLSGLYLAEGVDDLGCCVHETMAMAARPARDWGLAAFRPPFIHADVVLVDSGLGVPTDDCVELGRAGGETDILQELQHERLRAAVAGFPAPRRKQAYSDVREFIVRRPVVAISDLKRFCASGGRAAASRTIEGFYRDIPAAAVWPDRSIKLCAGCGALPAVRPRRCRPRGVVW